MTASGAEKSVGVSRCSLIAGLRPDLAEEFLSKQELRGFTYHFSGVKYDDRWPNEYGVVFDVRSPKGAAIDGPVVLRVNKHTREVRADYGSAQE